VSGIATAIVTRDWAVAVLALPKMPASIAKAPPARLANFIRPLREL
jgi:hypothetical protein